MSVTLESVSTAVPEEPIEELEETAPEEPQETIPEEPPAAPPPPPPEEPVVIKKRGRPPEAKAEAKPKAAPQSPHQETSHARRVKQRRGHANQSRRHGHDAAPIPAATQARPEGLEARDVGANGRPVVKMCAT